MCLKGKAPASALWALTIVQMDRRRKLRKTIYNTIMSFLAEKLELKSLHHGGTLILGSLWPSNKDLWNSYCVIVLQGCHSIFWLKMLLWCCNDTIFTCPHHWNLLDTFICSCHQRSTDNQQFLSSSGNEYHLAQWFWVHAVALKGGSLGKVSHSVVFLTSFPSLFRASCLPLMRFSLSLISQRVANCPLLWTRNHFL